MSDQELDRLLRRAEVWAEPGEHESPGDEVAHDLAKFVLKFKPLLFAALSWRQGVADLGNGRLVDTDDGSCEPGLARRPGRNDLVDAIDDFQNRLWSNR